MICTIDGVLENELITKYLYLTQKFKLSTKSYLPIQYYGFEYDEDLIWAYMEAQKVRKFKAITIENNLLLDTFQNQENIVHMRGLGRTRSWRFNHNRTTIKYDLEADDKTC